MLARVLLERKYGSRPAIRTMGPHLAKMLEAADAALIIGDPALRIEPDSLPYEVFDLGKEWTELTDSTMVFALWSGPERFLTEGNRRAFRLLPVRFAAFGRDCHEQQREARTAPGPDSELSH